MQKVFKISYLKHLEMFTATFEFHIKKEILDTTVILDATDRLKIVLDFDKNVPVMSSCDKRHPLQLRVPKELFYRL